MPFAFVYVMKEADRQKMLQLGYTLMKSDSARHVWIFGTKDDAVFSADDELKNAGIKYVLSNTLTF